MQLACVASVDDEVGAELGIAHAEAELQGVFARGLAYRIDGKDYYLHGPMEGGAMDMPGYDWVKLGSSMVLGRHFNNGPFGIQKWWSSDAAPGQLLYIVIGKIDTWSPGKAALYRSLGFSHYHHLMTEERAPHPTKVMWLRHSAVAFFTLDGGSKPWLAHAVTPGVDHQFQPNTQFPYPPREELLYVGCVSVGDQDPDFLAVVGANPDDPATYGQIIHRVDMPDIGDELHHYGFNITQTKLLVPGLFSGRLHLINIADDPAHPYVESYHDDFTDDSGYIVPHTVIGMPDGGYLLSALGSDSATSGPGGVVKLDSNAHVVGPFGPPAGRDPSITPPTYMYDIGINVLRNSMISTSFGLPDGIAGGINPAGLGHDIYVWNYRDRQVTQVVNIGQNTGALEVRWLHQPGSTIGFTNAPGTSQIWRWDDVDLDGVYSFSPAITLPVGSIPTDIVLSKDDKYMYIANWFGNNVMQYDIRDPFNPVFVSLVTIPHAQMMRLSPDNKRLYVTNSLLSTWDDDEVPAGVTRNQDYGIYLVDIDHEDGGMSLSDSFFVDLDHVQRKNTMGAGRPHQVFFDANVRHDFGDH